MIHTDFEKGFIKAEVAGFEVSRQNTHTARSQSCAGAFFPCSPQSCGSWQDYKAVTTKPSEAEVKAAGKHRQEGKTYVMADGDICHFLFNQ